MLAMLIILWLLNVFDLLFTLRAHELGSFLEVNPVARIFLATDLLTSAVSDAHTAFELGRTYNEIPEFDGTGQDFKRALAQGRRITRRTTPLVHVATSLTKIKKRLLRRNRTRP